MLKNLRNKAKNKKGFTLVELIVVIVIILILAAVLVPSLMKYIDSANKANCKADAASLLTQVQADYAAYQADETKDLGKNGEMIISGVTVTKKADKAEVVAGDVATKGAAMYQATATDVTSFAYNNGKYTAVWNPASKGWVIEKVNN